MATDANKKKVVTRKVIDVSEDIAKRITVAASKMKESEATVIRIAIGFGVDALEQGGYRLQPGK